MMMMMMMNKLNVTQITHHSIATTQHPESELTTTSLNKNIINCQRWALARSQRTALCQSAGEWQKGTRRCAYRRQS